MKTSTLKTTLSQALTRGTQGFVRIARESRPPFETARSAVLDACTPANLGVLAVVALAVAVGLFFLASDPIETHDTPGRVIMTDPIAGSLVHRSTGAGGSTLATAGFSTGTVGLTALPANLVVPANKGAEQTAAPVQDTADAH